MSGSTAAATVGATASVIAGFGVLHEWFGVCGAREHPSRTTALFTGVWLMAHINGSSNTHMRPVRAPYGSPVIRYFEASTAVSSKLITVGDIVTADTVVTTGQLRVVIAPSSQGNAGNLLQNGITSLIGVAVSPDLSDGGNTGLSSNGQRPNVSRLIGVAVADGLTEFAINLSSVGANPIPVASSMIGNTYPIECLRSAVGQRGGHGVWFLSSTNLSTAADLSFVVTDVPSESIGDTGGVVYGKFLSTMVHRGVRVGGPFT